jgi:hypothetical protein
MSIGLGATLLQDIITLKVRPKLLEMTPRFWSDAELLEDMKDGIKDLWGAILDLHGDHYFAMNTTDVWYRANTYQLSGVPADCFRVQLIEPLDITMCGSSRQILFIPRKYKSPEFVGARTRTPVDPGSGAVMYYEMTGIGPPQEAPRILVAPQVSCDMQVRLCYNPTITINEINPIPGSTDNALRAWTIAYALAKEQPQGQRIPDAGWLSVYSTEKQLMLTRLTPRQEQEPDVVEDMFQF